MNPENLDLDQVPEERPASDRPSWPVAVIVLVVAALTGAWWHSGLTDSTVTVAPRVSAWVGLDTVQLADTPVAVLRLTVTSHEDVTVYLTSLRIGGAGLVEEQQQVWRPLAPGLVEDLRLPARLRCRPGSTSAPLELALIVTRTPTAPGTGARTGTGTWTGTGAGQGTPSGAVTVTAVPGGAARTPGGLCQAGEQQLPQAYRNSLTTRLVSASPGGLTLTASGLPEGAGVFSARADGWLLPLLSGTAHVSGGAATLTLGPAEPHCSDSGTRGVLPTGVQLVFTAPGVSGVREAYAPVGTELARWLLDARRRVCPT